ncbi:S8 family serine peptidase [Dactylosporangium sp. CA-092794]|uniref:S8 family serine peptidase n=1 Tax=Dactylosporangium sp. CA-092794 TaxID=3239929 RepID=UPI003D8AA0C1
MAKVRTSFIAAFVVVVAVGAAVLGAAQALAAEQFVKYYTVAASYQGAKETLAAIANRLLGSADRAGEIFDLNAGRTQPDGGRLTDPSTLHAGWILTLPWDAVGPGVVYGPLPAAPAPSASPAASPTKQAAAQNRPSPPAPATSTAAAPRSASAAPPTGRASSPPAAAGPCAGTVSGSTGASQWAQLRMAPAKAWTQTKGRGQLVAVVDSGVDASLPELTGHVSEGADIVSGSGRGDVDCLGSGTAMAALIVAQPGPGAAVSGIAPDATVMPIRVTKDATAPRPDDVAAGIGVAVSAKAGVIALGPLVDTHDPAVAEAVVQAAGHGIVVVGAAPTGPAPQPGSAEARAEEVMLRVGGIEVAGDPIAQYRAGAVDVVAPGGEVTSLGIAGTGVRVGTGTHLAVAFAAAVVALVRSAHPDLDAPAVVQRIKSTSDALGGHAPDTRFGFGLVNAGSAVTAVLAAEQGHAGDAARDAGGGTGHGTAPLVRTIAVTVMVLVALVAAALVVLRLRRVVRPAEEPGPAGAPPAGDGAFQTYDTDTDNDEDPWAGDSGGARVWGRKP